MASNETSGGIGIGMVLFLIFLVLKLTNTIDWSWWWVTSPLWIPFALFVLIVVMIGLIKQYNMSDKVKIEVCLGVGTNQILPETIIIEIEPEDEGDNSGE